MRKVLISGYYGFQNQGDEAILSAIVSDLNEKLEGIDITVLTANAKKTAKNYNVKVVNRNKYWNTIKAIYTSDMVISGGGSLLQDVTSPRSLYYYISIILLSKMFRKKVVLLSHGIGPINSSFNRKLTGLIIKNVDYISVRDYHSKKDLDEMKVSKNVNVSADPVIDIKYESYSYGKDVLERKLKNDKKKIGMSIRSVDFENKSLYIELKKFVELISQQYNVIFLPFHYQQDTEILRRMKKDLSNDSIHFLLEPLKIQEMLSIIDNFDLLIGTRLHSLIFSAVVKTPLIGISYDPKIDYFLDIFDKEPIFKISSFNSTLLMDSIESIFANKDKEVKLLADSVNELKGKFNKSLSDIIDILES